jgi:signal transduction histidine kinase
MGGVAAGIADYLGLTTTVVRVAFFALALAGGVGVAAYAVLWVFLAQEDGGTVREDKRAMQKVFALLAVGAFGTVVLATFGFVPELTSTAPLFAIVAGVVLVWQQADVSQRERWRQSATADGSAIWRIGAGAVLLGIGAVGFLASRGELAVARAGLLSTAVVVVGLVLLSSPWWFAMATDLREERRERIRSQERAEVAAHLHDSVLQTLALIQKAARSPAEVTRLARSQERELRNWLYASRSGEGTLAAALEAAAAEVEQTHEVPVDVVAVGDLALDESSTALVAAAREAMVNAARHSGAPSIDVYAEVEPGLASVFVRDRGKGFDPAGVPDDRHGISGSIEGRMTRHGGTATVRSSPGEGTEVRLELPRG